VIKAVGDRQGRASPLLTRRGACRLSCGRGYLNERKPTAHCGGGPGAGGKAIGDPRDCPARKSNPDPARRSNKKKKKPKDKGGRLLNIQHSSAGTNKRMSMGHFGAQAVGGGKQKFKILGKKDCTAPLPQAKKRQNKNLKGWPGCYLL